ncbi:MAG: sensor histidine kinase [Deltaproteobacteria bacterium]|nr:sensor histidine kinase [Deltaproteobacteria bacterium]
MRRFQRSVLGLLPLLALFAGTWFCARDGIAAQTATPKRVLLIHSFGRDFSPYESATSVFRSELAKRLPEPIVLFEATLDAGQPVSEEEERTFVAYLRVRYAGRAPDLVVTIGPPAARLFLTHRDQLFPSTPLVMAALDERLARGAALRPNDAAVVGKVDLPRLLENIFQLRPDTTTVAVVIGASPLEEFWLAQLQREATPFEGRAEFQWLSDLSLDQMKERAASLPPHSAVLYRLLIVDAAGVPHERQDALAALHASANAPIFGLYEKELGKGVVGGPYTSQRLHGEQMAEEALRILRGAASDEPQIRVTGLDPPVYDWRELERWGIDSARLPAGSEIRFAPLSMFQEHRVAIAAAVTLSVLQAALISVLLWQRIWRRRAEHEARSLGGRLITAQEDERRRLARDLHDDVTQRLAALAIQAAKLEGGSAGPQSRESVYLIRDGLVALSEDVHALSYRLHPTIIEDLGLVEALRAECDRVAHSEPLRVELDAGAIPARLPADAAVGLFRVAQEALRNVVRHAKASDVRVALHGRNGRLLLAVRDNGAGFEKVRSGASLGFASMRERMRLLGGTLDIESAPGHGTTISAWVPLAENA